MTKVKVTIETDFGTLKNLTPEQVTELRDILLDMCPVEAEEERRYVPWSTPSVYPCYQYPYYQYPVTYGGSYTIEPTHILKSSCND